MTLRKEKVWTIWSFRTTEPIIDKIRLEIAVINSDANLENRVMEILDAYKGDSLDAFNINRDGKAGVACETLT